MQKNIVSYTLLKQSAKARRGVLHTAHGDIQTPVFMPVGTNGAIKALSIEQVEALGPEIILANSYHLFLRPGIDLLKQAGGLHRLASWSRAYLTDSGGFQVFSLSKMRKFDPDGVHFRSHIDGSKHFYTPELVMQIQGAIGSDIAMVLDDCPALPATQERLEASLQRSIAWAKRCTQVERPEHQGLFGIVQGGLDLDLRKRHLEALEPLALQGLAIGGLSVGETPAEMHKLCADFVHLMPPDFPRYLMGVGTPWDLVESVAAGVDMFDCVMPTRNARMGTVYIKNGERLNIRNAMHKDDLSPLDNDCECMCCKRFSRAYLRHLFVAKEITAVILLTIHNIHYYLNLMRRIRAAIENDSFEALRAKFQP
ncbi:MAG: tRNA guanosine(34) transglycosylase Tgt [Bradymonadales bacterium]|jgi:queuine tRNA-ribosyltransferase